MKTDFGAPEVAKIIVSDTIRTAHGGTSDGDVVVKETLAALRGPQGLSISQAVMSEYAGGTSIDSRVARAKAIRVAAGPLKEEMTAQLEAYLSMAPEDKKRFRLEIEQSYAGV